MFTHPAQIHSQKFFNTQLGRDLLRWISFHLLRFRLLQPLHPVEEWAHKLFHADDGGNRIAWIADHRFSLDLPENRWFARHYCHPVYQHFSQFSYQVSRMVFRAGRRPGVDNDQVIFTGNRLQQHLAQPIRIVWYYRVTITFPTPLANQIHQHPGVEFYDLSRRYCLHLFYIFSLHQFVAGGDDQHLGLPLHLQFQNARCQEGPQVISSNQMVLRQQEFGGHNVFANLAHVLPGIGSSLDFHLLLINLVDILHHDDCIGVSRHGLACINPVGISSQFQLHWTFLGGAKGTFSLDRNAIHGRRMKSWG